MNDPGSSAERARLTAIAADSRYAQGANAESVRYTARVFSRFWRGKRCLELGPAEGLMTDILAQHFSELTAVEAAPQFCASIQKRHPAAKIVNSLFENFDPPSTYDTIVMGHVLEHVEDPPALLRRVKEWLTPDGVICAAVPNARSLHRQAAVLMGMLGSEHDLNEADIHHGHRRVYSPETFRREFTAAGLRLLHFGGFWLKPVSNAQIAAGWNDSMLQAFMQLGERYPDVAAEIYVVTGR
jgi:2-polyprenyl-3-methyl-5-hydroxy-6-metoxy-1,4-benzoquinol methylase